MAAAWRRMWALGVTTLAVVGVAWMPGVASAGTYHVYSCRTPAGASAPVDGWSGSTAGVEAYAQDTCAQPNGALVAALGDGVRYEAGTGIATWALGLPSGETLAAATLWRAGDADGGTEPRVGFQFMLTGPDESSYFESCIASANCPNGMGVIGQPFASQNLVSLPAANLGGHIYLSVACQGAPNYACPENVGDPNHYAAVVYLYAADLTLEQQAGPSATSVGGELASASTVGGTSDVTFAASDPGAGVYEAQFSVDGQVVQSSVVNENGGRCKNVGETSDGRPAFLYLQPCLSSVSADVGLDTTRIANGAHHLVVTVLDPAGNAAPVLDRQITIYNKPAPGTPGPANGVNASAQATLAVRWKHSAKAAITSSYGSGHVITGRLTAAGGVPIVGAQIEVLAKQSVAAARATAMASPHTDSRGDFTLRLPRGLSSRALRFIYRAHLGDPVPAAARTLRLNVRAPILLTIIPRITSVGRSIAFHGRLRGGPVPAEGKQLILEARAPGGAWIEFQVVRTDARGRFHAGYRFKFPGPAVYQFRARSEPESDYPFAAGASRAVAVRER